MAAACSSTATIVPAVESSKLIPTTPASQAASGRADRVAVAAFEVARDGQVDRFGDPRRCADHLLDRRLLAVLEPE